ncbi:uncharacterized protein RAG0_08039 [Rhynchosporium agropyri]|uniref:PH domain-like protein n=1 Tax=Rhynchosporium agropyri TaxID=914238 RepID=A0A1E1KP08_9HELO|nr:uncharacterized protein RAG0_08039 [Rhynchosporium agropyri]
MPPKTPRKSRRGNPQSSQAALVQASDYDTEAFEVSNVPTRTPAEINFSVLSRYVPSLETIICYAPSAQLYTMQSTGSWEKESAVEGTLFICQLTPSPVTGGGRHCVVLLNRKGLENLIVESGEIQHVEIGADSFLMLGFKPRSQNNEEDMKVLGLFIQAESPPKEEICQIIKGHWEEAVRERSLAGGNDGITNLGDGFIPSRQEEGDQKVMGRRLSLSELFGKQ